MSKTPPAGKTSHPRSFVGARALPARFLKLKRQLLLRDTRERLLFRPARGCLGVEGGDLMAKRPLALSRAAATPSPDADATVPADAQQGGAVAATTAQTELALVLHGSETGGSMDIVLTQNERDFAVRFSAFFRAFSSFFV